MEMGVVDLAEKSCCIERLKHTFQPTNQSSQPTRDQIAKPSWVHIPSHTHTPTGRITNLLEFRSSSRGSHMESRKCLVPDAVVD